MLQELLYILGREWWCLLLANILLYELEHNYITYISQNHSWPLFSGRLYSFFRIIEVTVCARL